MKKSVLFFLIIIALFSFSCRSTRYVTFNAVLPAEITFDPRISSFVIADRTQQNKEKLNILEGVLSGELPGDDKKGVSRLMMAFKNQVETVDRFTVSIAEGRVKGNSILNAMQAPAPWEVIDSIAEANGTHLVVLVESFDSNFAQIGNIRTPIPEQISHITVGLRIYDPVTRTIVDEQLFEQNYRSPAIPLNPLLLQKALIDRSNAVAMAAEVAGRNYAFKISPSMLRIRREFYARGKKEQDVARGTRNADVGKWEEAIDIWKKALDRGPKRRDGGRLCLNIAVAYEVIGDLDQALEWGQRGWTDYRDRRSDEYVSMVRRRINDQQILRDQMGND